MKVIGKNLLIILLFVPSGLAGQVPDAFQYWKMEHDSVYLSLQARQNSGDTLNLTELNFLTDYKARLLDSFNRLPDKEKALYYQNRNDWSRNEPGEPLPQKDDEMADQGDRSAYIQHLWYSGYYGLYYGGAANFLFGLDGPGAAGVPFLTAGVCTLIPMLTLENKKVTTNSLLLAGHGKLVGAFHGAALGFLIMGDNSSSASQKLKVAMALGSSIGLGHLGFKLGERESLSQGQVALYRHYGLLMPLEGIAVSAALEVDNPRVFSAFILGFGAAGYLMADKVGRMHDYSRGDVIGMKTLTLLNSWLGFGIMANIAENNGDFKPAHALIPATLAMGGTLLGQMMYKDIHLGAQQGRYTLYGAAGGALIGLGLTVMAQPESITPYYVVPYITGLTSYLLFNRKFIVENNTRRLLDQGMNRWNFDFSPQNFYYAKKMGRTQLMNPSLYPTPPLFTATLRF
ncbi:MAG: hypothetical protein U0T82_15540 [Bacteroidales bacterium]